MSIKPLDMQVMIPKTQKVASIRHIEQQRANVNQDQIAQSMKQQVKEKTQHVIKSNQNEKSGTEADARKKGRNTYQGDSNRKKKNNKEQETNNKTSMHHIDIRV